MSPTFYNLSTLTSQPPSSELHELRSLAVEGARERDRDVVKSFERSLTDPAAQAQMAKDLKFNRAKAGGLQWGDFVPKDGDSAGAEASRTSNRHGRGIVSGVTYKADVKHKSVGVKASTMTSLMETVAVSHPGGIDATEYGDALDPSQLEELARMSAAAASDGSFAYTMEGAGEAGGAAGGGAMVDESHLDSDLEKVWNEVKDFDPKAKGGANVKVVIRIRPQNKRELKMLTEDCVSCTEPEEEGSTVQNTLALHDKDQAEPYTFT